MKSLEVDLYYRCPNRCVFCANDEAMRAFADHPLSSAELAEVLERKAAEGYGHVNFTGGEPTLHPEFLQVLALAKGLGYQTQVTTSGHLFSLPAFVERALPLLDIVLFSLHGRSARVHDAATRHRRSFERICKGLAAVSASAYPVRVWTNTVVTRLNAGDLPGIYRFAAGFGRVSECWFTALLPGGLGAKGYGQLAVPHRLIVDCIPELLRSRGPGWPEVRFYNMPFCVLGAHRGLAGEYRRAPSLAVARRLERNGRERRVHEAACPQPVSGKVFAEGCKGCLQAGLCGGLWGPYALRFGGAEASALLEPAEAAAR